MNFEMAQEMAEMEGIEVASVVVDDDIAVEDSLYTQGAVEWQVPFLSIRF